MADTGVHPATPLCGQGNRRCRWGGGKETPGSSDRTVDALKVAPRRTGGPRAKRTWHEDGWAVAVSADSSGSGDREPPLITCAGNLPTRALTGPGGDRWPQSRQCWVESCCQNPELTSVGNRQSASALVCPPTGHPLTLAPRPASPPRFPAHLAEQGHGDLISTFLPLAPF